MGENIAEKLYKTSVVCILFGIACILKCMIFNNVWEITELMAVFMPWVGIILFGIGFYLDL